MSKSFLGVRLRKIREERGLTQLAAARALGLSASYYNQLENDERPMTVAILVKVSTTFEVDMQLFSEEEEGRLITDLREAITTAAPNEQVSASELREVAAKMPAFGRALITMHRRLREATETAEAMASRLGDPAHDVTLGGPRMPFEEVRDFVHARHNYFPDLDDAAERLFSEMGLRVGDTAPGLEARLADRHGVRVVIDELDERAPSPLLRKFDARQRVLHLDPYLLPGQRAFQMATQLAFLEMGTEIQRIVDTAPLSSNESRSLARIGLASYFAGALMLPYRVFLDAAESEHYDIERLGQRFGVGFEVTCHRLSTLQRPSARGVPFFFVRVDRAGNVSKRQSATDFHFSRVGGTCPLWAVYEAFAQPGRILTQVARMPDGRTYFCIARTVTHGHGGYGAPQKVFSIGMGCDLQYADKLVYSRGLDLRNPGVVALIGVACKVCERTSCPQRAYPPIGRLVKVDESESSFEPYRSSNREPPRT